MLARCLEGAINYQADSPTIKGLLADLLQVARAARDKGWRANANCMEISSLRLGKIVISAHVDPWRFHVDAYDREEERRVTMVYWWSRATFPSLFTAMNRHPPCRCTIAAAHKMIFSRWREVVPWLRRVRDRADEVERWAEGLRATVRRAAAIAKLLGAE